MDFHPVFDAGGGQNDVVGILNGFGNPVSGLLEKCPDLHAPEGVGMVVSVVRDNQYFQVTPFLFFIAGAHVLELLIERTEQVKEVAIQVLGVVRGANVHIKNAIAVGVVPEVSDGFVNFVGIGV